MSGRGWGWGVGLIALGLLLLLANLGLLLPARLPVLPIVLILFGVWLAAEAGRRRGGRGLTAGIVVMAVGFFWLAESSGWLRQEQFLAVLLIALGLGVLLRGAAFSRT